MRLVPASPGFLPSHFSVQSLSLLRRWLFVEAVRRRLGPSTTLPPLIPPHYRATFVLQKTETSRFLLVPKNATSPNESFKVRAAPEIYVVHISVSCRESRAVTYHNSRARASYLPGRAADDRVVWPWRFCCSARCRTFMLPSFRAPPLFPARALGQRIKGMPYQIAHTPLPCR